MRSSSKSVIAALSDQVARLEADLRAEREEKETLMAELGGMQQDSDVRNAQSAPTVKHGKRTKKKEVA